MKSVVIALGVIAIIAILVFLYMKPRKEKWFSRDITYGKANSILWNRYLKKGVKNVTNEYAEIRDTYKYPGTGDYTGMMCREPGNIGCTTYNILNN